MTVTRRLVMQAAMAGAATMILPRWARASLQLGDATLETLSDGHLVLPADFIFGPMPQDDLGAVLAAQGIDPTGSLMPECNLTLLRRGEDVVLFDAGSGTGFQESAGRIPEALDAAGLTPDDITHVVFTHGHPDHLWGVLDDFDDPLFTEAEHMMGRVEWEYWTDPETVDTIAAERTTMAVGAQRRLEAMGEAMRLIEDGEEILPGVAAQMTPGHTPGHMSFEIRAGSESVMVLGDAIGNHHVAFARPGWPSGSDQERDLAIESRIRLFERVAQEQMRIVGFHLPGGGIGRAERSGDGYIFVQET